MSHSKSAYSIDIPKEKLPSDIIYWGLSHIYMDTISAVIAEKQLFQTVDSFFAFVRNQRLYVVRESEDQCLSLFLLDIDLQSETLVDDLFEIAHRICDKYEKLYLRSPFFDYFFIRLELGTHRINVQCLAKETLDVLDFLLKLCRFFSRQKYPNII
ncbi:hypothetical protein HT665_09045 [Ursidibacter maritimus]|uniref:Uncharacterized protein n=1 Tax=Ursidibacter maritimus TaxID=1331689 RepID=A0A949T5D9_9PAST|nr:hypothetical protein [Ursidibacter maritimus]KAE9538767.1 hypothetical protein A1D26_05705 [Ursidibacter maritimus]MBV6523388.1 hypothetical protein [Ursidibacter maritimus]MBV6526463.1 hypothetical protein [Ursidibacter maritimus]MBV6527794.1 hypothetical protein [Ursidibacter maritimus]MBV6529815.1 hypothetical protein [Ursidibacter maritimus]